MMIAVSIRTCICYAYKTHTHAHTRIKYVYVHDQYTLRELVSYRRIRLRTKYLILLYAQQSAHMIVTLYSAIQHKTAQSKAYTNLCVLTAHVQKLFFSYVFTLTINKIAMYNTIHNCIKVIIVLH